MITRPSTHTMLCKRLQQGRELTIAALNLILPSDDPEQNNENTGCTAEILKRVIMPSMLESAIILSANSAAAYHLKPGTAWHDNPLFFPSLCLGVNFFSRFYKGDIQHSLVRRNLRLLRSALFAFAATTLHLWVHEGGHALTSMIVYKDANPSIQIMGGLFSPQGGYTSYNANTLTSFGEKLGSKNSYIMVKSMGVSMEMIFNYIKLISAQVSSDQYPEITSYLRLSTFINLINIICYAVTGYGDCQETGNDYCDLKNENISPQLLIVLIITSIVFLQACLSAVSYCVRNSADNEDQEIKYVELVDIVTEEQEEKNNDDPSSAFKIS